jgi:hypothetical protein
MAKTLLHDIYHNLGPIGCPVNHEDPGLCILIAVLTDDVLTMCNRKGDGNPAEQKYSLGSIAIRYSCIARLEDPNPPKRFS